MFDILKSAINSALSWLFQSVVLKFSIFGVLYFVTSEFFSFISELLPSTQALSNALSVIPSSAWYFLNLLNFSVGLPMVLLALASRFIIRRIPIIG